MRTHTLKVRGRRASLDDRTLVQGAVGEDVVALDLDEEWDGLTVTVAFKHAGGSIVAAKDGAGYAVPWECNANAGRVSVAVEGTADGKVMRHATIDQPMVVLPSEEASGASPTDPTASEYRKAYEDAKLATAAANGAADDAKAAAGDASKAAGIAGKVADEAKRKADEAGDAAVSANAAAFNASKAAEGAEAAKGAAEEAAADANDAAREASQAAQEANSAAGNADTQAAAAQLASQAASNAAAELKRRADAGEFKGDKGDPGEQGEPGPQGKPGPQGEPGPAGPKLTFADLTDADKAELSKPATDAAATANAAAKAASDAADAANAAAGKLEATREPVFASKWVGSSTVGERLFDSVGKSATVSTDTVSGHSDFDGLGPFAGVKFKCKVDSDGRFVPVAAEGTPAWDAAGDLDQLMRFPNPYCLMFDNGDYELRAVSSAPFTLPEGKAHRLVQGDDTEPDFIWVACYNTTKDADGKSRSVPGEYPAWGGYSTFAAADAKAGAQLHSNPSWFGEWTCLLPVIEFNDRNVQQSIAPGFSNGILTNSAYTVAEDMESGNTVKCTSVAPFVVGQGCTVGKDSWHAVSAAEIACDERTITAIDAEAKTITLDGEPFSATAGMYVSNLNWKTGSTDSVLGHTGAPAVDSKHPMKYRGIEDIWGGGNEPVIDIRLKPVEKDGATVYDTWYCPNPLKARDAYGNAPTADFQQLGLLWPEKEGYVKRVHHSEAYPWVLAPAEVGASTVSYQADYFYQDPSKPDNRAPRSGFSWTPGARLGAFFRNASYVASDSNRFCLARLFQKP